LHILLTATANTGVLQPLSFGKHSSLMQPTAAPRADLCFEAPTVA
jgi:hypothetical protein